MQQVGTPTARMPPETGKEPIPIQGLLIKKYVGAAEKTKDRSVLPLQIRCEQIPRAQICAAQRFAHLLLSERPPLSCP